MAEKRGGSSLTAIFGAVFRPVISLFKHFTNTGWSATGWLIFVVVGLLLFTEGSGDKIRLLRLYDTADSIIEIWFLNWGTKRRITEIQNAFTLGVGNSQTATGPVFSIKEGERGMDEYAVYYVNDIVGVDMKKYGKLKKGTTQASLTVCVLDHFAGAEGPARYQKNLADYKAKFIEISERRTKELEECGFLDAEQAIAVLKKRYYEGFLEGVVFVK